MCKHSAEGYTQRSLRIKGIDLIYVCALSHSLNSRAVAATDSFFVLVRTHQHGITFTEPVQLERRVQVWV